MSGSLSAPLSIQEVKNLMHHSQQSGDSSSDDGFSEFVSSELIVLKEKIIAEHQRLTASWQVCDVQQAENGTANESSPCDDAVKPTMQDAGGNQKPAGNQKSFMASPMAPEDTSNVLPPSSVPRELERDFRNIASIESVSQAFGSARSSLASDQDEPKSFGTKLGALRSSLQLGPRDTAQTNGDQDGVVAEAGGDDSDKDSDRDPNCVECVTLSDDALRDQVHRAWHDEEACYGSQRSETFQQSRSYVAPMLCEKESSPMPRSPRDREIDVIKTTSLQSILSSGPTARKSAVRRASRLDGGSTDMSHRSSAVTFPEIRSNRSSFQGPTLRFSTQNNLRTSLVHEPRDWARSESVISFAENTHFDENIRLRGTPRGSQEEHFELLPCWAVDPRKKSMKSQKSVHQERSISVKKFDLPNDFKTSSLDSNSDKVAHGPRFIIHPSSLKHILWDLIGLFLIGFDFVAVPMEVFEPPETLFTETMGWVIRIFWTLNVPISFCTGYVRKNGSVELDPRRIALSYTRSWLAIDLLVVVFDYAEVAVDGAVSGSSSVSAGEIGGAVRTTRMLRIVRLFRIIKAQEITDFITEHIRSERVMLIAVIAKIMAMMLGSAHIVACGWYALGRYVDDRQTWVKKLQILPEPMEFRYATSLHWSLLQFSGTLLFDPTNMAERTFAVSITFTAFVIAASFVSSITTSMTRLQILSSQQSTQILTLRRYLADHNISRRLAVRVLRNAQHAIQEHRRAAPESSVELLKLISEALRAELHFEIYSSTLCNHPFFSCYSEVNPIGVRKVCHTAVSVVSLGSGDVLFSDLESPAWPRMFFLISGCLNYEQKERSVQTVDLGSFMCEATLWTTWRHCGTMSSLSESRILYVDAVKFQQICTNFSTDHAQTYGTEFVAWLNLCDRLSMTDLGELDFELEQIVMRAFPDLLGDDEDEDDEGENEERISKAGGERCSPVPSTQNYDSEAPSVSPSLISGHSAKAGAPQLGGLLALRVSGDQRSSSNSEPATHSASRDSAKSFASARNSHASQGSSARRKGSTKKKKRRSAADQLARLWRCCLCRYREPPRQRQSLRQSQVHPHPFNIFYSSERNTILSFQAQGSRRS